MIAGDATGSLLASGPFGDALSAERRPAIARGLRSGGLEPDRHVPAGYRRGGRRRAPRARSTRSTSTRACGRSRAVILARGAPASADARGQPRVRDRHAGPPGRGARVRRHARERASSAFDAADPRPAGRRIEARTATARRWRAPPGGRPAPAAAVAEPAAQRWQPGHQKVSGCPPTDRAGGSRCRSAGRACPARPVDRPRTRAGSPRARPRAPCARGRSRRAPAPPRREPRRRAARGRRAAAKQLSAFQRLPMPASVRWSSRASPIGRVGSSSRSRRRNSRSSKLSPITSGPRPASRGSVRARALAEQLEHGAVELDHLPAVRSGSRARPGRGERRQRSPVAVHAPGAASCAGASAREPALEAQEQVLAVGVDRARPPCPASRSGQRSSRWRGCGVRISSRHSPLEHRGRIRSAAWWIVSPSGIAPTSSRVARPPSWPRAPAASASGQLVDQPGRIGDRAGSRGSPGTSLGRW